MSRNADNFDVVVVGSGAGGGAAAWALSALGIKVLVLESGPEYDPFSDYLLHKPEWERRGFPDKSRDTHSHYTFAPMQDLDPRWDSLRSWNRVSGLTNRRTHRHGWKYHHVRGVGGSTLHFEGEAHRLHPGAMNLRRDFGVGADWPLSYQELEPYYVRAEQLVGVAGPPSSSTRPRSQPYPLPHHPPSYASQRVIESTRGLGLNWEPNSLAVLSRPYDGRPGCNYCNGCTSGCPRTDKGSVDVTFIRKARASGRCEVRTNATVLQLNSGADDRIRSLLYVDGAGDMHEIATRVVVLACGAVMTPRLLLLSQNRHAADGLANESGQVGRHFMETLSWQTSALYPEPIGSHRGLPTDSISWAYNSPDAIPGTVGGCRFTISGGATGPISYARRLVDGWGLAHKQAMRSAFGRAISVGAIGESLPNPGNYIDLDHSKTDRYGQAKARIHSRLGDGELTRMAFMAEKTTEIITACGAGPIVESWGTYDFFNTTHAFGTCRMGNDPTTSVVTREGRAHRWKNLYIADASVFPSSGGGESPALTIYAIAMRTAEKIREELISKIS